jgi:hypothetical protein
LPEIFYLHEQIAAFWKPTNQKDYIYYVHMYEESCGFS